MGRFTGGLRKNPSEFIYERPPTSWGVIIDDETGLVFLCFFVPTVLTDGSANVPLEMSAG